MKKITCESMGGPKGCTTEITGSTPEEMVQNGIKHMESAHPEDAARIKSNPSEVNAKWMEDFKQKFENLPEA